MHISKLVENILKCYEERNHEKTIKLLDMYVGSGEFGIYPEIINIYINCQINLGMFEEAFKNLEVMDKIFHDFYSPSKLIVKYILCRKIDKAQEIISKNKLEDLDCYNIGRNYFLNGYYKEAEMYFNYTLENCSNFYKMRVIQEYLRKIKIYQEGIETFKEQSYVHFKSSGQVLEPGHIIYAKKLSDFSNDLEHNSDPKKEKRPYLIWKIIDSKIYAFAISSQVSKKNSYILYQQDYPNFTYDRRVRDNIVCIDECNVERVLDKLNDKDYRVIIDQLHRIIFFKLNSNDQLQQFFIDITTKKLNTEINDVIAVKGIDLKTDLYFILDIIENKYKIIKLYKIDNDKMEIIDNEIKFIDKNIPILYNIKLTDDEKEYINCKTKIKY